jgi:hypothetical protein
LNRLRAPQTHVDASYAVVWAHLRKRYPHLRTVVVTGASAGGDATFAAVGLAEAAVRLEGGNVLVMVPNSAKRDWNAQESPVPIHTVVPADGEMQAGNTAPATLHTPVAETPPGENLEMTLDVSSQSLGSVRIVDALSFAQVRTTVSHANGDVTFTIVVAPPPQAGLDCISLAATADAVILVARLGRTRFQEAQLAAKLLRQAGVATAAAFLLTKDAVKSRTPATGRRRKAAADHLN